MKVISYITPLLGILLFAACNNQQDSTQSTHQLQTSNNTALNPYFTKDNDGHIVLCWTEMNPADSVYRVKYALYNNDKEAFEPAVTVKGTEGVSTSPESMAKVAFKNDGTVITVFAKRFLNQQNPFAGAIYYTLSANKGKTWTKPVFLHSDTSANTGRSFFDVAKLKSGELAATWLDGRFKKTITGSALFFAKTLPGKGFGADTCLQKQTCECCRTNLLADTDGNLHLAYRTIIFPEALSGRQVRDMAYIQSTDEGRTFSKPKMISNDNWQIEGCPHSGPSLGVNNGAVQAVWFTVGGGTGIYYAKADAGSKPFGKRQLLTQNGRHPQTTSLGNVLATVWEEPVSPAKEHAMAGHGQHKAMMMKHMPAEVAKIVLLPVKNGVAGDTVNVSNGTNQDHHAVITSTKNKLLIAWVRDDSKGGSKIIYTSR